MRARIIGFSALTFAALTLPVLASAATLFDTLAAFSNIFNAAIVLFITLAIVIFFWGLIQYILGKGSGHEGGHGPGSSLMFWGIVALFVMVSIWGIIRLVQNTFSVGGVQPALVPSTVGVQSTGGCPSGINILGNCY